jgi:histone H3/H4
LPQVILSTGDIAMTYLTRASQELFSRPADECYASLQDLCESCQQCKEESLDRWHAPSTITVEARSNGLRFIAGSDGAFLMNDWSFSQLCRISGVAKDTVNRLSADTAGRVLQETFPRGTQKPLQILTLNSNVRSLHGTQYTRLWNADLVRTLQEFAVDFQPPQKGMNGGTGLYAGEQDMFCFLIDPLGWVEIGEQGAFAPGFFVWNSEVGRRSLGIQTFWFQAVCQNHIVWDATDVVEFTRKHTAKVSEGLGEIRRIIEGLVEKRDARKDGFHRLIKRAMETTLGDDAEKALQQLSKHGLKRIVAKRALDIAQRQGRLTVWSIVDALTQLSRDARHAGERTEADEKAATLLQLVEA